VSEERDAEVVAIDLRLEAISYELTSVTDSRRSLMDYRGPGRNDVWDARVALKDDLAAWLRGEKARLIDEHNALVARRDGMA